VPRDRRITGDLVVQAPRLGQLVGFENHARDYVGAEASPLGRVRSGTGNGRGSGQEGVRMGDVIGTHLHGPVLAKNPRLADAILGRMCSRAGLEYVPGEQTAVADRYAEAAREAQLTAAGIAPAD
jgi:CobQ-like glutamine amidotransferase family enzyme